METVVTSFQCNFQLHATRKRFIFTRSATNSFQHTQMLNTRRSWAKQIFSVQINSDSRRTLRTVAYDLQSIKRVTNKHTKTGVYIYRCCCLQSYNKPATTAKNTQKHSQERRQGTPNRRLSGFLYKKNWLCWDVGPALFSYSVKYHSSLYQKCSVGLKYAKNVDPAAGRAEALTATTKKGRLLF